MNAYIVIMEEVYKQHVKIYADSEEEAIARVSEFEGEEDGASEYSYTLDKDTWEVEKIGKKCDCCDGEGFSIDTNGKPSSCPQCAGSGIEEPDNSIEATE